MQVVCPALYQKLVKMFGSVIVANNMEQLQMGALHVEGAGRARPTVAHSGEYYRVNCMFCRDTRKRLWVNHRFSEFPWLCHCFNDTQCMSGQEGRPRREKLHRLLFETNRPVVLPTVVGTTEDDGPIGPIELPGEVVPLDQLSPQHQARWFMEQKRGYDASYLAREFGIGYIDRVYDPTQFRLLEGRVFIPVVMGGELVGWQGRWPEDLNWKEVRITKYYNLRGMAKRRMFYNYDSASRSRTVVLVEGVTDVWSVGWRAVSLLGSELTQWQKNELLTTWRGGTCVVMLDGDAVENNRVMARELRDSFRSGGGDVVTVSLPVDRDPGDLSYEANWAIINDAAARQGVALDLSYS